MKRDGAILLLIVVGSFVAAEPAYAHSGTGHALSFAEGLLHPVAGWDHIMLLLLGGGIVGLSGSRRQRLSNWEMLAFAGLFTSGAAIVLSEWLLGLFGLCLAAIAFIRSLGSTDRDTKRLARLGCVLAVALQMASHYLAIGDGKPDLGFAAGFSAASLILFWLSARTFGHVRPILFFEREAG